jgi:hypothetical protein
MDKWTDCSWTTCLLFTMRLLLIDTQKLILGMLYTTQKKCSYAALHLTMSQSVTKFSPNMWDGNIFTSSDKSIRPVLNLSQKKKHSWGLYQYNIILSNKPITSLFHDVKSAPWYYLKRRHVPVSLIPKNYLNIALRHVSDKLFNC